MSKFITVKLAERKALLMLNNEQCRVKLKSYDGVFTTSGEIRCTSNATITFVKELNLWVDIKLIKSLEIGNRFNENIKHFMEVAWED